MKATARPESSRTSQMAAGVHLLDGAELAIRDVPLPVRRRELHAVAHRERAVRLAIERHALQPARVVGDALAALARDREAIVRRVHLVDPRIRARLEGQGLAARGVAHDVARLVLLGPLAVRAGDLLARDEHAHVVFVGMDPAGGLHQPGGSSG